MQQLSRLSGRLTLAAPPILEFGSVLSTFMIGAGKLWTTEN